MTIITAFLTAHLHALLAGGLGLALRDVWAWLKNEASVLKSFFQKVNGEATIDLKSLESRLSALEKSVAAKV